MFLNIPLAIWMGFLAAILLFVTLFLGIAVFHFKKNVFKYHKIFAFLTALVVIAHIILAISLWFFGIVI